MSSSTPSGGRALDGDNFPLVAASARFLIWATRNARLPEPAEVARPAAGEQPSCN